MIEKLIHQKTSNTCMSACVAMVLNSDFDTVRQEFHAGYIKHEINPVAYLRSKGLKAEKAGNPFELEIGYVYILMVPSLNNPAMFHAIVLDHTCPSGPELYDPTREHRQRYSLEAIEPGETDLASFFALAKVSKENLEEFRSKDG